MIARTALILSLSILSWSSVNAQPGVSFGSGIGVRGITPYRLGISWDFGPIWRENQTWGLDAIWESSLGIWDGPKRTDLAPGQPTDLIAVTTGPLFRWQRQQPYAHVKVAPYAELGVGFSWLSQTEIEGRILSLHFQFEDKAGVGVRFGRRQQYDVAVRAYHYSNCSIKRPNSGVNLAMINVGVWFPNS